MPKLISTLTLASLAIVLCTSARATQDHPLPTDVKTTPDTLTSKSQRKPAADFTLNDMSGKPLTLSALKGHVVLLNFWATWCGGCKLELPWYIEFDKKYRDKGLTIVGVSMDDNKKLVAPFLKQKGIVYPVVIGNGALGGRFNLESMPLTLLIDRNGKIAVAHGGVVDKDDFEKHIQQLLRSE